MKGSGGDGGDMMKMKMRMGMGRCDLARVGIVREHRVADLRMSGGIRTGRPGTSRTDSGEINPSQMQSVRDFDFGMKLRQ